MADEIVAEKKQWWKSKAVWAAVLGGIVAAAEAAGISVPPYVIMALSSFGLYAVRDGMGKPLGK